MSDMWRYCSRHRFDDNVFQQSIGACGRKPTIYAYQPTIGFGAHSAPSRGSKSTTPTEEVAIQPEQPTEAAPSPTSAPLASGTYTEDLSTTNGAWPELTTENYKVGYSKVGDYFISILQPNASAYAILPHHLQKPFAKVAISVNIRPGLEDGAYGIMCGFQDANNYYAVRVSEITLLFDCNILNQLQN